MGPLDTGLAQLESTKDDQNYAVVKAFWIRATLRHQLGQWLGRWHPPTASDTHLIQKEGYMHFPFKVQWIRGRWVMLAAGESKLAWHIGYSYLDLTLHMTNRKLLIGAVSHLTWMDGSKFTSFPEQNCEGIDKGIPMQSVTASWGSIFISCLWTPHMSVK